jgi:cellulose biosynthesis protein BcsQ
MKKADVIVIGNFKGGVGKTKSITMLSWEFAHTKNQKVLVIDLDPQGNATKVLARSGNILSISTNIFDGIKQGNMKSQVVKITDNLDLIPTSVNFKEFPRFLMSSFPNDDYKQITYLRELIEPLRMEYDTIFIDVPPMISDFSDSAMMSANYCVIVLQTQELSLDGAETYINYMNYLTERYNADLQVLGIIPMMLRAGGRVDNKVLSQAKEMYGTNVLDTIVKYQERLKVYDVQGITSLKNKQDVDVWDKTAHNTFIDVMNELIEHKRQLEGIEV